MWHARGEKKISACAYRVIVGKPEAKTEFAKSRLTRYIAG
jgi:hypothetical protein